MTDQPTFKGRCLRPAGVAGLALLLVCASPAAAPAAPEPERPGAGAAPAAADPVVAQVLQLLRGGVAEPVIALWLQKSGKRPAAVSSGDLVALHQAGASDELMKLLLTPAAGAPGAGSTPAAGATPAAGSKPAGAPAAAAPAAGSAAAPAAPAAGPMAPPAAGSAAAAASGPAAAAAPGAPGAPVKVRFAVTYRPIFVDAEEPLSERWLLCLYVNGRFVAAVKPESLLLPLPARTFDRELAPGKHLLRVTQERHLRYSSRRGYTSPARIDPSEFPFELQPAAASGITIRFAERSFRHRGPVAVRIEQDGKETARLEPAGADPETWPALCEDIPAALPAGAKLPGRARHELASCVHWTALWPGIAAVPSRDEVRAEIARLDSPPGGPTP